MLNVGLTVTLKVGLTVTWIIAIDTFRVNNSVLEKIVKELQI